MKTGRLIYAASEQSADMLYATGMFVPDPFLWCEVDGNQLVVVSPLEYGRFRKQAGEQVEVVSFDEAKRRFGCRGNRPEAQIAGIGRTLGVKRWEVPGDFPLSLAAALKRRKVTVRPAKDGFFPNRQWKSAAEVELVTEGVRLAEAGLEAALAMLREARIVGDSVVLGGEPLTAERLRGAIDSTICGLGGIAAHTIVAPGPEGADPHNEGHGPVRPHEPVIMDIFPRVTRTGYFGDLTRTVVKGKAPEVVKKAFAAVQTARDAGKAMIKAGVNGRDVHARVAELLTGAGFETDLAGDPPRGFFHGTGHGLGLEIHEAPRVSKIDSVLESGHIVTVEPGLYYPEWGGVRLEDVVAVEATGSRTLTSVDTYLEID